MQPFDDFMCVYGTTQRSKRQNSLDSHVQAAVQYAFVSVITLLSHLALNHGYVDL